LWASPSKAAAEILERIPAAGHIILAGAIPPAEPDNERQQDQLR
jgi:hypothetical protein